VSAVYLQQSNVRTNEALYSLARNPMENVIHSFLSVEYIPTYRHTSHAKFNEGMSFADVIFKRCGMAGSEPDVICIPKLFIRDRDRDRESYITDRTVRLFEHMTPSLDASEETSVTIISILNSFCLQMEFIDTALIFASTSIFISQTLNIVTFRKCTTRKFYELFSCILTTN
jgi:hypothetical protein